MGGSFSAEEVGNMRLKDALHSDDLGIVLCASLVQSEWEKTMKLAAARMDKNISYVKTDKIGRKPPAGRTLFYE